jgi:hypothetical protein
MKLTGLHLLLTYRCLYECDHCFVWGGPRQQATMTLATVRRALVQASELEGLEWLYLEGGEPFLYYPVFLEGVRLASERGYRVGVVTNGYWATAPEDARAWLQPLAGKVEDLSISSDPYHGAEDGDLKLETARDAARSLGIPADVIRVAQPEEMREGPEGLRAPEGMASIRYRGRAACELVGRTPHRSWESFTECPGEELREPERVHLDPYGHVHLCQGISLGNVMGSTLREICEGYEPEAHPIVGPLLAGGPAELVRRYGLGLEGQYADACHLCYEARRALRERFPEQLVPDEVYGVVAED